jgi:hypothetical protein
VTYVVNLNPLVKEAVSDVISKREALAKRARYVPQYAAEIPVGTFVSDEPTRQDRAQHLWVGENLRLLAVMALTVGVMWFLTLLR